MHHGIGFIQDLAVVMALAGVVTVLFHRLKQPVVLGYIVAGVIIGPYTPPFQLIHDEQTIQTLGELGVVFLMFSLGLEFSLRKLFKVGATAIVAALSEIVLMLWLGYEIGSAFGWSSMDSLFLGAILAISSTTIIVKALSELGLKRESFAQLVFGILIVEDILAIAMLVLLSGIAQTGQLSAGVAVVTLGKLLLFMTVSLVVGILVVPRALNYVARAKSDEMLLVSVLGFCFGFCLLVVKLDYSIALGAFLIGAIMAESRHLHRIEHLIAPLRDMFSAIFFVTIGLMLNPAVLVDYAWPIAVITVAVIARQDRVVRARHLPRRQGRPHGDARRHDGLADRRVLVHHRVARFDAEGDERVSVSDRGGGVRVDHAVHAVSDPRGRPAYAAPRPRHAAHARERVRHVWAMAAQSEHGKR